MNDEVSGPDSAPRLVNNAWTGFIFAPLCGHLLFALTLLISDVASSGGVSDEVKGLLLFTSTLGLVATYLVVGLIGLPTAYALERISALNLWTLNLAAMVWTILALVALHAADGMRITDLFTYVGISSLLGVAFLLAPFILLMSTVFFWITTQQKQLRFSTSSLLILVAIVATALSATSIIWAAIQPRVVVCVRHPNGARLLVTQDWRGEPFDTSIFFDDGRGSWRWYYFEHEDWYWGNADSSIAGNEIRVSSGGRSVTIDTLTGRCRRTRRDGRDWTTDKSTRTSRIPPVSSEIIDRLTISLSSDE